MRRLLSLVVFGVVGLTGCGGVATTDRPDVDLTLLLDDRPSAIHAGIYLAIERGYDEAEGVELTLRRSGDAERLLSTGRVQAALLDEPAGNVCVMTFRQQPTTGPYLCVPQTTLEDRRPEVAALVRALQRGYSEAEVDPESAVSALVSAVPSLDRATVQAEIEPLGTDQIAGVPEFGYLDPDRFGPPDFDTSLVRPESRD